MSEENKSTIIKRQNEQKSALIEQLRSTPIVQVAAEKIGIGRATYYRWRKDDPDFAKACEEAIAEGVGLVCDLAESKLIQAIKDQNYSAISFYLRHHNPSYADKLQIKAQIETNELLTPEQETAIKRAVEL